MNRELRRVTIVVLAMFLALFAASSIIQVGQSDNLAADPRNQRTADDRYDVQRGSIIAGGQVIAQSVPSKDDYKWQRQYTNGPLYSAVTGYDAVNGAETGIEAAMDSELSGTSNADFLQRVQNLLTGKHPQGDSVELTINPKVQEAAFNALGSLQGAVVVTEVKTGRILALVSTPSYDPNTLAVHDNSSYLANYDKALHAAGDPLVNKAITDLNPPGSAFKPVVSSAAFMSGKYTKNSTLPNPSSLSLPGSSTTVLNDTGYACDGGTTGPEGKVTIEMAQVWSCNIPFAELGMQLGSSAIKAQAEKFGWNHQFSIPMPVSVSQYPGYADQAALAQSSFGQNDDKATALQLAMDSAGIANGGVVMQPGLVQGVLTPDLQVQQRFTPKVFDRAISPSVAATVTQMMVEGVQSGVATNARISGVSVAGKTGTAQNGANAPYTLWFTGFAPANSPKYAVSVVVENGGNLGQSGTGNTVAAPIAQKVLEAVLGK